MRNAKVLVIIPAFNEEAILAKTVQEIKEKIPCADLLVVNDGSTDDTLTVLKKNNVKYLNLHCNLGIGGAVQSGYIYAFENDYDYAVQIDGDGQHDPSYVMPIIEQMEKDKVDVGIGSRFIVRQGFQSTAMRRFGIHFLSMIIKATCGARILDVTSGYRIVNRRFVKIYAQEYSDDYPEPEAIITAKIHNGRIVEYPVVMRERITGVSSINTFKAAYYMVKVTLAIAMYKLIKRKRIRG